MTDSDLDVFVRKAGELYETQLRVKLEPDHLDEFVAIEPISGDYFLGRTLSESMGAAHRSYPDRLTHAMRVGYSSALHFGLHLR